MLKVGDPAPSFTLKDQDARAVSLQEYRGKWLILYFYPKDDTPGCTAEACSFSDDIDVLRSIGAEVVGISKDSVASHQMFTDRYSLPFTLLSDTDSKVIRAYGARKKKALFGRSYWGTARVTYLIDPQGLIAKVYPHVKPATHAEELIRDLKEKQA